MLATSRVGRVTRSRVVALGTASFVTFGALLLPAQVGRGYASADPVDETADVPASGGFMVDSMSNALNTTYELPDGTFRVDSFSAPVNYLEAPGDWEPIDNTLVGSPGDAYAVENAANDYTVRIPEDPSATPVRFTTDDGWVTLKLRGVGSSRPEVSDETATMDDVAKASSVSYVATNLGVKENVVLDSPPPVPPSYTYDIAAAPGLSPYLIEDGSIEFRDAAGTPVVSIPAGNMIDSAADSAVSESVSYELDQSATGWSLLMTPDPAWLTAPERVYPVTIDPSLVSGSALLTCFLGSANPTESHCGNSTLYVKAGRTDATHRFRGLMDFNTSVIPSNAVVASADAYLYLDSSTSSAVTDYGIYRTSKKFDASATWNSAGATGSWTGGSPSGYTSGWRSMGGGTPGWKSFGVTEIVEGWQDGTFPKNGLVIQPKIEVDNVLSFRSASTSWASTSWPYLQTTYSLPDPDSTDGSADPLGANAKRPVEAVWDAVLSCMKNTGQVAASATVAQVFGAIDVSGALSAPTMGAAAPLPTEACADGASTTVLAAINGAPSTDQATVDTALVNLSAQLRSGQRTVSPSAGAPLDTAESAGFDRVPSDGTASSDCNPGASTFMRAMNDQVDKTIPDWIWNSNHETPCMFNWDDDVCTDSPDKVPGVYNFTYPCKRHDFGYTNAKRAENRFGSDTWRAHNKNVADKQFLKDASKWGCVSSVTGPACETAAMTYYTAVSVATPWNTLRMGSATKYKK